MRETKLKSSKGITLIALVITIIVLLILAGVAISMLSGDNGILKQAANAKTETEKAADKENKQLQSTVLEMHFVANNKNRKASNGYVTNIKPGETAGDLKKDLPEDYKIYNLKGEELQDTAKLGTGMTIKDNSGEIVSKIIIFGDLDGVPGFTGDDSLSIGKLRNEIYDDEFIEKEIALLAADADNNGIVNKDDEDYIAKQIVGEVTIEQNRYVAPNDILLETKAMERQKEIDEAIVGFPTTYEKVYNNEYMCYDVKIEENSLTVEQLEEMFPDKVVKVYEIINYEEKERELKESGNIGNDYVLMLDGKLCLWFKV